MPPPLIDTDDLARLIEADASQLTILDVRWDLAKGADRDAYLEGHIAGAAFVANAGFMFWTLRKHRAPPQAAPASA